MRCSNSRRSGGAAAAAGWCSTPARVGDWAELSPTLMGGFHEGLDIGLDRRAPVDWELRERHGVFRYGGTIHEIIIEFRPVRARHELRIALGQRRPRLTGSAGGSLSFLHARPRARLQRVSEFLQEPRDGNQRRDLSQGARAADDRSGRHRQAVGPRGVGPHRGDRGVPQRSARRRRAGAVPARPANRARPRGRRGRRGDRHRGDDS